jgi:glycosyltransferase involved in cell wall biosynthesis
MGFVINGKFTSQRITGVQRVAFELTRAMQALVPSPSDLPLVIPPDGKDVGLAYRPARRATGLKGNLWEQVSLPLETGDDLLLSLCNTGPLLKRRQLVMIHDMAVYDVPEAFSKKFSFWYRLKFSVLRRQTQLILTVSDFSRKRICHHLDLNESQVEVIRPGADHMDRIQPDRAILSRLSLEEGKYCVLVGSLDPRKNLQRVLAATKLLEHRPDIKFVVAGGANPRIFAAQNTGKDLHSQHVTWAGFVSDEELKALYGSAACLVFPSLYEGYGLPPLEAMYCGCPVITSSEASLPEVCGDAALYCDPRSVEDIAAKIEAMVSQPELREMHRRKGLARANLFKWDRAASQLLQILQNGRFIATNFMKAHSSAD